MTTTFSVTKYCEIAKKYDPGNRVQKNRDLAIQFYEKAYHLKSKEAAFRLGEIYQRDFNVFSLPNRFDTAGEYFIKAVTWGYLDALIPIEELRGEFSPEVQLKVGDMFRDMLSNDRSKARFWYEYAHKNGNQEAQKRIKDLKFQAGFNQTSLFFTEKLNFTQNNPLPAPKSDNARPAPR